MKKNSDKEKFFLQKKGITKNFSGGMYAFVMFIISYYERVKTQLKIDYDSFIIVQVGISHTLYYLNKRSSENVKTFSEIQSYLHFMTGEIKHTFNFSNNNLSSTKLTISSVCLVTSMPKETVRRKVQKLINRKILKMSDKNGISPGESYKKIFNDFPPQTVMQISKLLNFWKKNDVLDPLLNINKTTNQIK